MSEIYFDSKSAACKSPFGAISTATAPTLTVFISRRIFATDVYVHILKDGCEGILSYRLEWSGTNCGFDAYSATVSPLESGLYWYYFSVNGRRVGNYCGNATFDNDGAWQLSVFEEGFMTPDWIKGGVYYHIFVDRFNSEGKVIPKPYAVMHKNWNEPVVWWPNEQGEIMNNDFFGGNLAGITKKIPYLKKLGVTCLYLSPIFEAYSNHKYDTADYMRIDSMFGDENEFKTLCDTAHKSGIRVILDGVFNHVGADSVYFNRYGSFDSLGAYQSTDSPYFKWFSFKRFPNEYDSWWGFKTLPNINELEPSFTEFVTGENGVIAKWMRLGADGWRLDVADELPDEFIAKIRERIRLENPHGLLLGEVWEDASTKSAYGVRRKYFGGRELDCVMNYPFRNAIIDFVRNRHSEQLCATVCGICENYPAQVTDCLMNLLGTHDSDRIITALAGDDMAGKSRQEKAERALSPIQYEAGVILLKMAAALQMTLPGVPCIYYGDEAGIQGYNDPFNRTTYPWGNENTELQNWYTRLCKLRADNPVFKDGKFTPVVSDDGFFAFLRESERGKILVAINRDLKSRTLNFSSHAANLLNGEEINKGEYTVLPDSIIIAEVKVNDLS